MAKVYLFVTFLSVIMTICHTRDNLSELKQVFKPPTPGTEGIEFVKSRPSSLYSKIEKLFNSTIKKLHLTIQKEKHSTTDLNFLWKLPHLEYFWLRTELNCKHLINLRIASKNDSFLHISHLYLHVKMHSDETLTNLLSSLKSLKVLDLSQSVIKYNLYQLTKQISFNTNTSKLRALSLREVTGVDSLIDISFTLNFTQLLEPLEHCPLEYLDLSHNNIYVLQGSLLQFTKKLRILDLSYNHIANTVNRVHTYAVGMLHPTIEVINVQNQNIYEDTALQAVFTHVETDSLPRQKRSTLPHLTSCLRSLNATINSLSNHGTMCKVIYCLGKFTESNVESIVPCKVIPQLSNVHEYIDMTGSCSYGIKFPIAPNLKEINMAAWTSLYCNDNIGPSKSFNFCFQKNKLTVINLSESSQIFTSYSGGEAFFDFTRIFGMEQLESLYLQDSYLHFNLSMLVFSSFPNLKKLNVSGNFVKLGYDNSVILTKIFKELQVLDISNNQLFDFDVPYDYLSGSKHLQVMNLGRNNLHTFDLMLNNTPRLSSLDLSSNKIRYISKLTRESLLTMKQQSLHINLQNNLLYCGCALESFDSLQFMRTSSAMQNVRFTKIGSYTCNDGINTLKISAVDIHKLQNTCFPSNLQTIVATVCATISVLLSVLLGSTTWKFRYRLYTSYYRLKWHIKRPRNNSFKFDAFICYCADDRFWVHDTLMKELEDKYRFRLCIHYRDFIPGGAIADLIEENISSSRCIIVILSQSSLKSNWCMHELYTAHTHSIENGKPLIIVKQGQVKPDENTPSFVKAMLSAKSYMEWPEIKGNFSTKTSNHKKVAEKQKWFWVRLSNTLYESPVGYKGCFGCCRISGKDMENLSEMDHQVEHDGNLVGNQHSIMEIINPEITEFENVYNLGEDVELLANM